jgi:hypothetical protein
MQPYQASALQYLESGLGYPIPSAYPMEKFPPVTGWTGRDGRVPNEAQVRKWMDTHPDSNVLIRLAPDVIGIDVDDYDEKHGWSTITDLQDAHGKMPVTYRSSAREFPSGIFWYRLRSWMETDKMRDPGEHVEVIRYGHRYICAPPSWHQGAHAYYEWNTVEPPQVGDLTFLPTEWYVHLTRGCDCFEMERADRRHMMRRLNNRPKGEVGAQAARDDLIQAAEALTLTAEGGRNQLLSSIAGRFILYDVVTNEVLSLDEVTFMLMTAAEEAGLDQREAKRTIQSAIDWAIREGQAR